jgi:hypothetical protein
MVGMATVKAVGTILQAIRQANGKLKALRGAPGSNSTGLSVRQGISDLKVQLRKLNASCFKAAECPAADRACLHEKEQIIRAVG